MNRCTLYHGTPVSGTREDARKFLSGRHGLVSFAHPGQLDIVKEVCKSYILDNGAFSIWRKGGELNPRKFMQWATANSKQASFDYAFIPDIIDGSEDANDGLIQLWKDEATIDGCPIWHLDESLSKLERLSHEWPIVAFGSSGSYAHPGTQKWWVRMSEALPVVCDDNKPRCKLHGLRMMNPDIFTHIPFTSVDSTNATQNGSARAAAMNLPHAWQGSTVIAWRLEQYDSPCEWHPEYVQQGLI